MDSKFYFKRGKASSWQSQNLLLGPGEPGFEIDTGKLKVGNGIDKWNDLPYINYDPVENENAYFVEANGALPTGDIKDGTFCVLNDELYVRMNGNWKKLENSGGQIQVIKIKSDSGVSVDGKTYETFDEAIAAAADGATLKVNDDITSISIPTGKNITINLNGADIVNNEANPIQNAYNAFLNIEGEGKVECNKHGASVLENKGTTSIMSGSFSRTIDEKGNGYYVIVNHGEMNIYNGVFSSPGGLSSLIENGYYDYLSQYHLGESAEYPTITINGGTFINSYTTIKNDDAGICVINDGNFYGMVYNVGKSLIINGGYFYTNDGYEIIQCKKINDDINAGALYINGGVFETTCDKILTTVNNSKPEIIIKGGKFNKEVPVEYIASGYIQKLSNDGYYTIEKEE